MPKATYMDRQHYINAEIRAVLVDCLVRLAKKYKLKPETIFLSVSIVDRFLEQTTIQRQQLLLVGVTGIFIAVKFEETLDACPLGLQALIRAMDCAYNKDEVL